MGNKKGKGNKREICTVPVMTIHKCARAHPLHSLLVDRTTVVQSHVSVPVLGVLVFAVYTFRLGMSVCVCVCAFCARPSPPNPCVCVKQAIFASSSPLSACFTFVFLSLFLSGCFRSVPARKSPSRDYGWTPWGIVKVVRQSISHNHIVR